MTVRFWQTPEQEPQASTAHSEIEWLLGERFVGERFEGQVQAGGEARDFEGYGLTGYDNLKQAYVGVWADNQSTAVMRMCGKFNEAGELVMNGSHELVEGGLALIRSVCRFVDDDHVVIQVYRTVGDQPEYRCLELSYQRR